MVNNGPLRLLAAARKITGLSAFRIRWYEDQRLLGPVVRSEGGQRLYSAEQIERLQQISAWRASGLPIGDIKLLLDVSESRKSVGEERLLERALLRIEAAETVLGSARTLTRAALEQSRATARLVDAEG